MIENKENVHELPKGWVFSKIFDVCKLTNGRAFKPKDWSDKGLPIIRIQNLNNIDSKFNFCDFKVDSKFIIDYGRLLFAWSGTPGTSFGAHIWKGNKAVLNQHIFKIEINENSICKTFLMYLINNNIDEYIRKAHGTAGLAHITKGKFEESIISLPPLPEQHRIVTKIEELFTRLDAGVKALKKIKAQIKRYRQSVLKYAFEGKLTEKWREEHKDELVPASVLLERIKQEREKLDSGKKKKTKKQQPIEISELPELPVGWVWCHVMDISVFQQYGTSEKANDDLSGFPVLRMGNIQDGKLCFDNLKYFPKNWSEIKDFLLEDGDVLFNRTNSAELVGKSAVYKNYYPKAVFASYLIRIRVNQKSYKPDLLSFFINSVHGRKYIKSVVSQQVGQANVNGTKLSFMPIPFISYIEQQKIVEEIEHRFSIADEVEKIVDQGLKQANRLRQSILKEAFEGKLVPQDPTDEPASVLLEWIKAEKAKQITENAKGKRSKKETESKQMRLM